MSNTAVERKKKIKSLIESDEIQKRISAFMGGDRQKVERFKAAVLNAALDPALKSATPNSIVKAAIQIAELGLPLTKSLGLAYIVKYKSEAQAQVGGKGWQVLLKRAGWLLKWRDVYDVDHFRIEYNGFEDKFSLVPDLNRRKKEDQKWFDAHLRGIWVSLKHIPSGEVENYFVTKEQLERLANMSPAYRARKGHSPYETGFKLEMYVQKAAGWVARRKGIEDEKIAKALELENESCELPKKEKKEDVESILDVEVLEIDGEVCDDDNADMQEGE